MFGFCSLASLITYEKTVERLVIQWPNAWGLICYVEDMTRKQFVTDKKLGKPVPTHFREDDPLSSVFRALAQDDKFWAAQVANPAVAWTASGDKGNPVTVAELTFEDPE